MGRFHGSDGSMEMVVLAQDAQAAASKLWGGAWVGLAGEGAVMMTTAEEVGFPKVEMRRSEMVERAWRGMPCSGFEFFDSKEGRFAIFIISSFFCC